MRHTLATDLTAQGVSLRVVQEALGHTSIQMTTRYAHVAPSTLRESIAKLSYRTSLSRMVWSPDGHQEPISVDKSPAMAQTSRLNSSLNTAEKPASGGIRSDGAEGEN